jgi:predicted O-methyltransferase YrrM
MHYGWVFKIGALPHHPPIFQKARGALEFLLFPGRRAAWGGPLNGQESRQKLIRDLLGQLDIQTVVETGTYRGTSTGFFSDHCIGGVYTFEANLRQYGYAKLRLLSRTNVTVSPLDSRRGLRALVSDSGLQQSRVLFYLDAHWAEDLPLAEEVEIIMESFPHAVIVVDDFQVPGDAGYGYDNYGVGKALTYEYLRPLQQKYSFNAFFPTTPSAEETGGRRGCVVLSKCDVMTAALRAIPALRIAVPASA